MTSSCFGSRASRRVEREGSIFQIVEMFLLFLVGNRAPEMLKIFQLMLPEKGIFKCLFQAFFSKRFK